jgi:Tol biopolymer transport system component
MIAGCSSPDKVAGTVTITPTITHLNTLTEKPISITNMPTLGEMTITLQASTTPEINTTPVSTTTLAPILAKPQAGSLVFVNQTIGRMNNGVYVINYPDGAPINITPQMNKTAVFRHPSWSPDGKWIVFAADDLDYGVIGRFDLYIVGADGNGLRQLTYGGYSFDPTWSPDGEWISYVANYKIYRIHPDGSGLEALIIDGTNCLPEWSPDGQYLAYCHNDKDNPYSVSSSTSDLCVLDIRSKRTYTLVKGAQDRDFYGRMSWSNNSQMIYFRKAGDCDHLYRIENKEGAEYEKLDFPEGNVLSLSWSPDGKWMSYILYDIEDNCLNVGTQLFAAPVDESYSVPLVDQSNYGPVQVAWSPVPGLLTGESYQITELGDNLNLRDKPALNGVMLKKLRQDDTITILDGPVQADNYYWWKMRTADGIEGWAVDVFGWYQKQP